MAYISAFHPSSKPHKENNNKNTSYYYVLLYTKVEHGGVPGSTSHRLSKTTALVHPE